MMSSIVLTSFPHRLELGLWPHMLSTGVGRGFKIQRKSVEVAQPQELIRLDSDAGGTQDAGTLEASVTKLIASITDSPNTKRRKLDMEEAQRQERKIELELRRVELENTRKITEGMIEMLQKMGGQ